MPFDPTGEKRTPPPDPVAIEVDPAILAAYAGTYDMQPTAMFEIKFGENHLFIRSQDGQSWAPMLAETETRFFVKEQEDYRLTFIRDGAGTVTALQVELQGIQLPLAKKVK